MKILDIFRPSPPKENIAYPESYSIAELIEALRNDGFTPSHTLQSDIQKFGLKSGIVIANDGSSGMRINIDENGIPRLNLYNGLKEKSNPLSKIASKKYLGKIVTL